MGHTEQLAPHPGGRPYLYRLNLLAYTLAILPGLVLTFTPDLLISEWPFSQPASPLFPLYLAFTANLAGTLVIYIFSVLWGNSSMFDAYWSVAPPAYFVSFASIARAESAFVTTRAVLIGFLVGLWPSG